MNFKILTVNGQDLSGVTHSDAAGVLQNAPEPITVVLARSGSNKDSIEPLQPTRQCTTAVQTELKSTSTQTQISSCFCRFLLENSLDISSPFSSLIMSELMRYRENNPEPNFGNHHTNSTHDCTFPIDEEEDDFYSIEREEITLHRPSGDDKLGIMLRDRMDPITNQVKVFVTDVAPGSIAAASQKIHEGDQILKIDGEQVECMNDASRLLYNSSPTVSFLVGHTHFMDNFVSWVGEDGTLFDNLENHSDVQKCVRTSANKFEEPRSKFERDLTEDCVNCVGITSQKMPCGAHGTAESGSSNTSTGSSSQTGKDSGIGHTLDSRIQSATDSGVRRCSLDSRMFGFGSNEGSKKSHSLAREFAFVQPQTYHMKKRVPSPQSKSTSESSIDSDKGSTEITSISSDTELRRLSNAIQNMDVQSDKTKLEVLRTPGAGIFADEPEEVMSPWVKIARQDYEDKLRQLEKSTDSRYIHPAMGTDGPADLKRAISSHHAGSDNTSSAYSTGESFRSSSTASAPRLSNEFHSPPLSPKGKAKKKSLPLSGITMTYYVSSDANSDGEGPACYLTHAEDSESEGFEDAGLEFSSTFHSSPPESFRPVPLPRLLHPPYEATNFMSHTLTASTRELWKAAAAVARSRRQPNQTDSYVSNKKELNHAQQLSLNRQSQNPRQTSVITQRSCSRSTDASGKDRSESETIVASNFRNSSEESTVTKVVEKADFCSNKHPSKSSHDVECKPSHCVDKTVGPKVRRSSEHARPNKKHLKTQRSFSCVERPNFEKQNSDACEGSNVDAMEWKVRICKDGTRYITKRPVREKVLRHREKRILAERCGVTTDDDVTELKLGRHWSRDDRKRHLRIAREKKRRRDFMQRCRLEVLNENAPADGEIVELCHKKMTKQKHKRMLLDSFVTVQEILAHGDRTNNVAKVNPLLSVTYI